MLSKEACIGLSHHLGQRLTKTAIARKLGVVVDSHRWVDIPKRRLGKTPWTGHRKGITWLSSCDRRDGQAHRRS